MRDRIKGIMMTRNIGFEKLKFSLLMIALLAGISFAANCGGATTCNCGDSVTSNYNLPADMTCAGTALNLGADNIIIDCKGHTITGTAGGIGIHIYRNNGVTAKNCVIRNFEVGINIGGGNEFINNRNNKVDNCNITGCSIGMNINSADSSTITNVNSSYNSQGLACAMGADDNSFYNVTVTHSSFRGVIFEASNRCKIDGGFFDSNAGSGIQLHNIVGASISNIITKNSAWGIYSHGQSSSGSVTITNVTATGNTGGIYMDSYTYMIADSNISNNNGNGLYHSYGSPMTVVNTTISGNSGNGILMDYNNNNLVYYNNILSNSIKQLAFNTCPAPGTNLATLFGGGNFWGRTTPPLFVSSSDTNCPSLQDTLAFNQLNGWRAHALTPDLTAPTTLHSVTGAPSADGVYTNNVNVNFYAWDDANADDEDSGTKFIYYKYTLIDLNGNVVANSPTYTGPQGTYSWDVPFTCTCGTCNAGNNICTLPCCTYNLEYWAVDNQNNLESHKTGTVKIDQRSAVETIVPSQTTTVANAAGTAIVTIPASAYSQPLDFIMEPSEQSFAPTTSGMVPITQPLDLGPQC